MAAVVVCYGRHLGTTWPRRHDRGFASQKDAATRDCSRRACSWTTSTWSVYRKQREAEACSRAYLKKCTQSLVQGIGTIFLDDIKEEIDTRCSPTEEYHKNFLEHAKCFNTIGDSLHKCMRTLTLDLDAASKLSDKNRIGGACCKFNEFEECFARSVKGKCDEEHGRVTVAKYAGELLSTVCSPYRSGEKCASINFDPNVKGDPNVRALITPLIKVGEALG